jgi:hypothetical protein
MARLLAALQLGLAATSALTLSSPTLSVSLDDVTFPAPLSYTLTVTGEVLRGTLQGWGFHTALTLNKGQVTCGEAATSVVYEPAPPALLPPGADGRVFTVTAGCVVNWEDAPRTGRLRSAPLTTTLTLIGTVSVADDPAVPGAGVFGWVLSNASLSPPLVELETLDVAGLEMLSLHPAGPSAQPPPGCMYTADMNGVAPKCGGDNFYVDAWTNDGIDEWWSSTWDSIIVQGTVDVNGLSNGLQSCIDGASSRGAPGGPFASVVAGGWTAGSKTGSAVVSTTQKHVPLWTGPRSYDLPGRCSVFTIAPSTLYLNYACGSGLPYEIRVGVFPDLTADGGVSSDDLYLWRRMQFPRADLLYRTTLPYKIFLDGTAYTSAANQNRILFSEVLDYVRNQSVIFDGYSQTAILVGWQGLGHDTLYPALDVINARLGGSSALAALVAAMPAASGSPLSSVSYHVNADEAYSQYAGAANAEFDARICRLNADHLTPWARNGSLGDQTPNYGIRCSISKTKDNVKFGRYARYARFFDAVPAGTRTVHSDAWRDVGASWEPDGFIPWQSEEFCGQRADAAFWASHGMSLGVEGEDGQAQEFAGTVSYEYHADGWSIATWGRVVGGTGLGFDYDVDCANPGTGKCGWVSFADSFYTAARLYQLALTDELLGEAEGALRFAAGGRVRRAHTTIGSRDRGKGRRRRPSKAAPVAFDDVPQPSTWPYGGDSISIVDGRGGYLLPLVMSDGATLDPNVMHAYQSSNGSPSPDPGCPLYQPSSALYEEANNTAFGNWASPDVSFEIDPSLPESTAVQMCNASCWGNATCGGWDLVKVTPNSGHVKPLCGLYAHPVGCNLDLNQWAGVKAPLPVPEAGNQSWTLPLSWVGSSITATSLTPVGPVPGTPAVEVNGRGLKLVGVTPTYPVRLTRS